MAFPGSIPSYTGFTSGETLQAAAHASQHNSEQTDIIAIATKVGTGSSTSTNNTVLRGNGTGTSAWGQVQAATDITGILGVGNGGTGVTSISSLLTNVYPVGSIYTEITGTNPATTFGFGTWVQHGQGQVLVGQKNADSNFGTVGNTGGEATHTLVTAELPAHTHDLAHTHSGTPSGSLTTAAAAAGSPIVATASNDTTLSAGTNSGSTGSGTAHNNLQPYIVVFFWRRTA